MIVAHINDVEAKVMTLPDTVGVVKRSCVTPANGWEGYVMRVFDVEPGGHTGLHNHPWPHINYIPQGTGILHMDGTDYELTEGSFAYVPADVPHQFRNAGKELFRFICIVPEEGDL